MSSSKTCTVVIALQAPARDYVLGAQGALQGRWMFPMIGPFMVMLCLGWSRLLRGRPHALPLIGHVFATIAVWALVGVIIPAFYESFPETYRWENLFLRGTFGRPIDVTRLMVFVERPTPLRSAWFADVPVAIFVLATFAWPSGLYVWMRRHRRATIG